MDTTQRCPECGAEWLGGETCEARFHQTLAWEWEDSRLLEVHHLMVLCYHLQHPGLYSPEGLQGAKGLLVDFLERGLSPEEVRRRDRATLDSGKRAFKIKGTPESHGAYDRPIQWTMTSADVATGGMDGYIDNVRAWARSIYESLRTSGNLASGQSRTWE